MVEINKAYLLDGFIMHSRIGKKKNNFKYCNPYIYLPLNKIAQIKNYFFAFNKNRLFSIHQKNYKNFDRIHDILKEHKINQVKNISFVTQPKSLFYIFNPVSFFLCFNNQDQLIAVLSEVNNRSNQTHSYLIFEDDLKPLNQSKFYEAKKEFYVSPFYEVTGKYKFKFIFNEKEISFYINYFIDNKLALSTYLKCFRVEFNNKNLLKKFLKSPLSSFKTTYLIHYQALKLFIKGIKFNIAPQQNKKTLTTNHD